jgi:signal transduction histidine kinase
MEGVKVNLISVNTLEALRITIELQQSVALEKGISIHNNLDLHTNILADKDMLQLVVRNLLSNAIKFTQPGGEISISQHRSGNRSVIAISDNGIGIDDSKQQEIFSLKGKSTYGTKKEKGFGLGLVLCKEFTEMQNGEIWFESTAEGTTFYISHQYSAELIAH